jgi:hypothetical protein
MHNCMAEYVRTRMQSKPSRGMPGLPSRIYLHVQRTDCVTLIRSVVVRR